MTDKGSHNCANTQIENLDGEVWKDIDGYEGTYQVSNMGRVRSIDRIVPCRKKGYTTMTKKGRILNLSTNRLGYKEAHLYNYQEQKERIMSVHRLVAFAFIPNPDQERLREINHIDENKSNNRVDNLEWCDRAYNIRYGSSRIRAIKNNPNVRKVAQYSKRGELIARYGTIVEASRATGLHVSSISKACRGKLKKSGTYIWRYIS